jgi:hypothetical protein
MDTQNAVSEDKQFRKSDRVGCPIQRNHPVRIPLRKNAGAIPLRKGALQRFTTHNCPV